MSVSETREIGRVQNLEIEDLILKLHRTGKDWEIAEIIDNLQERGLTQEEIGEKLDLPRYEISRYKRLLNLISELFEALKDGEIARSTGYELSKLEESKQKEYAGRIREVRELREKLESSGDEEEGISIRLRAPEEEPATEPEEEPGEEEAFREEESEEEELPFQ